MKRIALLCGRRQDWTRAGDIFGALRWSRSAFDDGIDIVGHFDMKGAEGQPAACQGDLEAMHYYQGMVYVVGRSSAQLKRKKESVGMLALNVVRTCDRM